MDSDDVIALLFFVMIALLAFGGLIIESIVVAGLIGLHPIVCAGPLVAICLAIIVRVARVWFSIAKDEKILEDPPAGVPGPAMRRLLRRAAAVAEESGDLPPELVERYRRYRDRERVLGALCIILAILSLLRNVYGILIMAFVFFALDWPIRTRKNDALYDIARQAGLVNVAGD